MSLLDSLRLTKTETLPLVGSVAFAVAGLCAMLAFMALSALATPRDGKARVEALAVKVADIERLAGGLRGVDDYPPDAICDGGSIQGATALRKRLTGAAEALGLDLTDVKVSPGVVNDNSGLAPVTFSLAASAQYDTLLTFLEQLGRRQPELFVDTVKLTPKVSVANLTLTGRIFCWTYARR